MDISFDNLRQAEGILDNLNEQNRRSVFRLRAPYYIES